MPFAEAGLPPIGLDYSAPLLHLARRRDPRLGLVRGEMRSLPFPDGTFAAVVNFFTSFGYFLRESENVAVVAEIERVLRPGGAFLCDTFARDWVLERLVPEERRCCGEKEYTIRRSWNPETAAHREGDRGPPRGVDRDLPRKRAGVRCGRARHALLPRRASRRGDLGRLRRIAGRARFASPHRSRAPTGAISAKEALRDPLLQVPRALAAFPRLPRGTSGVLPRPAHARRRGGARARAAREGRAGARSRVGVPSPGTAKPRRWPRTSPRAAPSRFRPASRSASSRARLSRS